MIKRVQKDSILGGVCSGFGKITDTSPWLWRLIFLFVPSGVMFYLLFWIALKEE